MVMGDSLILSVFVVVTAFLACRKIFQLYQGVNQDEYTIVVPPVVSSQLPGAIVYFSRATNHIEILPGLQEDAFEGYPSPVNDRCPVIEPESDYPSPV
ncbi:MAG: hypothetical protein KBD64_02275 [Gammaproteobacteria bacterium]|nr:hypothetical protein [Gammaproteobacteria bacterium]